MKPMGEQKSAVVLLECGHERHACHNPHGLSTFGDQPLRARWNISNRSWNVGLAAVR